MHTKICPRGKWQHAVLQDSGKDNLCLYNLLSFFLKTENWDRYVFLPLLCIAVYFFLDFMAHQIIHLCKNQKPMHFFFPAGLRKEKNLFLCIFSDSCEHKQHLIECAAFLFVLCISSCSWLLCFLSFGFRSYGKCYF